MHHTPIFIHDELPDISPTALAELNHAFRREVSSRAGARKREKVARQQSMRKARLERCSQAPQLDD